MKKKIEIKNKKAYFNYDIIKTYNAGIILKGTEIKSIRNGDVSFTDSYCLFNSKTELYVKKLHISEYENTSYNGHEPKRDRKLLLTRKELLKLEEKVQIRGYTIIPLKIYINDKGLAKIEIGLASGKKKHDKRQAIKEKDLKLEQDREIKNYQ